MTGTAVIHLERLLGSVLLDAHGYTVGRIEEVEAEPAGNEYLVTHVLVGSHRWLTRLLGFAHEIPTLRALGLSRRLSLRRIPWTWLDLSDPDHPRLLRSVI